MPTEFLHGVEVVEVPSGPRPVRTLKSNIIGLAGTAGKGPVNTPTLITSRREGVLVFGADVGTIPDSLDGIYDQTGATVVVINVFDPAVHKKDVAAAEHALVVGVYTIDSPVYPVTVTVKASGGNGAAYVEGTDYALDADTGLITRIEGGKIAAAGTTVSIAYAYPDEAAAAIDAAMVGGIDAATGAYQGVHAFLAAESVAKVAPRILIAPGYAEKVAVGGNAGPVLAEMYGVSDRLRAAVITDGPSTTDAAVVTMRESIGHRRVFIVDPKVLVYDADTNTEVVAPAAARVAGVIAKSDAERGFWWSPSNRPIYGILGTARPVDFAFGDPNSRANQLNASDVATIIRQDGFRLWGNRGCSNDPKWAFLSVVRTADLINDSLQRAHLWAVDRCIGEAYLKAVVESVNAYLRNLKALGAILGGECWVDREINGKDQIEQGRATFDFDFTPCYPAEHVTFRSRLVNDYIEEIF